MSEIPWAEAASGRWRFLGRAAAHGFGLGCIAGGLEMVAIAMGVQLVIGFDEGLVLGLVSVLLGGAMGGGLGLVIGATMSLRHATPDRQTVGWSRTAGVVAGCLAAWYLWPAGWAVATERGNPLGGLAFALTPLGFAGVVGLHARYGLRCAERGRPFKLPWSVISLAIAALLVLVGSASLVSRTYGTARAIETDPSVVLITIDTLRRDHVSTYGPGPVQTPVLDELAAEGIVFENAVTPLPETAPAHAAMMTGRHPVRLKVLSNGHRLGRGSRTIARVLAAEGFATAAFVSSFAVDSRTGLDQGFEAYDDDFFPWVRGLAEIQLAEWGIRAVMRFGDPLQFRSLLERPAEETCARALRWVRGLGNQPYFLWVHLFDPHSPYEPHGLDGFTDNGTAASPSVDHSWILANEKDFNYTDAAQAQLRRLYAEEVAYTDQVLGEFLDRLRADSDRRLTIVVAADHGEMLGEHGIMFNHHGIWDETIRVPLIMRLPDGAYGGQRVSAQVRLMDVANTVLAALRLDPMEGTESAVLTRFLEGSLDRDLGTLLMGRVSASLEEGALYGYRAAIRGGLTTGHNLKYTWQPDTNEEMLFDLVDDPAEANDIGPSQPAAMARLREQVERELGDLPTTGITTGLEPADREALRALGYVE